MWGCRPFPKFMACPASINAWMEDMPVVKQKLAEFQNIETADPRLRPRLLKENPDCETCRVSYRNSGHVHRVGPADIGPRHSRRTEACDGADAERSLSRSGFSTQHRTRRYLSVRR